MVVLPSEADAPYKSGNFRESHTGEEKIDIISYTIKTQQKDKDAHFTRPHLQTVR